ncbi:MAG: tRNA (adenosine(37)-N6)-threonylcarbamoyltransferase complex ATPase subunit type 1 TsaE [Exiguobacterium chiriqhucha]|uniref:tRNA (adenosine(37)-N6)-threonylcarbamoyltransferase complex ATPase subunit type 1 TsaE n=1 Tax=Exiguobacterium TaxID=33986 RepID=UPI00049840DA|nr:MULTISPECIES: tRNA (adenosine(37)-N6)-threonylcarbamoyltransferase complex ATPase subunit type 1 TsaE [Exiguobacterium]KAB2860930.1 MAG: tRNA (adenosine(37)-N6)-threonylcarbamoyltransferase complex ATPase subunit type 1 TsaE [Exiguobacterium chiriqhucha]TCI67414.1 tRNA (adenosine(37)-N6)-threonylcarbamoyltransferase complex ATPase subunit type 1 TsaE [Exiguobacterium sp. IPCI3]TCI76754.1 tRNA (adenosine(37)-N6)-threonylcarbamoyltransferase complex ATPase subunit type 1 TsaE [Exiguobacterium s
MYTLITHSAAETQAVAEKLATLVKAGTVITLNGDLGAGKTTFTQGFGKGLGVTRNVNSPTFTIMKQYQGRLPLYHMDVYRLEDTGDDIGLEEYINGDGVAIVEWSNLIESSLPTERLAITIERIGDEERQLTFAPVGDVYDALVKEVLA